MNRFQRLAQPILRHVAAGRPCPAQMKRDAERALFLLGKPSLKRKSANQQKKAGRAAARQARNDDTAAIREAVGARAAGFCEGCLKRCGMWGWTMDHFDCGTGKTQRQSIENCWALCGAPGVPGSCHYLRQRNLPSVAEWNARFAAHCARYGYPVIEHILHQPVSAAAGGGEQ